ncbi:MAG: hypothetical protein K6E94_04570, partial [Elusimicrobiaceae bacterium]|nr:hypothetical protein [Elusimicrobiaceae bacterium]
IYTIKKAEPKFHALKDFTEKLESAVSNYMSVHGKYPSKISELNFDLETGYDGYTLLIGKGKDNIWCLISQEYEQVSCTQKVTGGRIGLFTSLKDASTKCITFKHKLSDINNRLCKQEFPDFNPRYNDCEPYSYVLSNVIMIQNNPAPDCKELVKQAKF